MDIFIRLDEVQYEEMTHRYLMIFISKSDTWGGIQYLGEQEENGSVKKIYAWSCK